MCTLLFSVAALVVTVITIKQQETLIDSYEAQESRAAQKLSKFLAKQAKEQEQVVIPGKVNSWLDVQRQVKDTVVQIFSHVAEFNWIEPYKTPNQRETAGSGFFINDNGNIITNYHVVAQASSVEIQIPSFGLERFDVEIIGVSPERDIALLKLTEDSLKRITKKLGKLPFLTLGDSDLLLRSQEVLALGYPLAQSRLKSTLGIVSGRERLANSGFIQITAPINPGNSGGPALNTSGQVIGINTCGFPDAQNVGYIIPINEVRGALKDLHKVKLLRKPTLGCIFTAATPEMVDYLGNPSQGGWYIAKVFDGTLLAHVGVKSGDMLYEINGHTVDLYGEIDVPWSEDKASLFEFLNRLNIGDSLTFTIYRKGTRKVFSFTYEHKYLLPIRMIYQEFEKNEINYEIIGGMVIMPLTLNHVGMLMQHSPDLIRYSKIDSQHEPALIITNIFPNSQAFKARILRPSEIITEVNGDEVKTLADLRSSVLKSKETGYLTIKTDDNFYAVMALDKILREEDTLVNRYFYQKSKLIDMLSPKQQPQNETGNNETR